MFHVSLVVALLIGLWRLIGDDAFMWVVIAGGPGAAAVLLFLPKRGPQYAYRNWIRFQALLIILAVVGVSSASLVAAPLILGKQPEGVVQGIVAGCVALALAVGLGLAHRIDPPTGRRSWLRRHYPAVAAAIRRYRQPGDVDEMYTPALVIDGKRQFLIFYHGKKGPAHVRGILLFDEQGRRVNDNDLAQRAAKCKSLALATIDYGKSQERARAIAVAEKAVAGMREVYRILQQEKDRFYTMGPERQRAWDGLMAAEEVVMAAIAMGRDIELLVAEWAAAHGLGRLTEVVESEAAELFERIEALRERDKKGYPVWVGACEAAGEWSCPVLVDR
ncbi:MAG: hypothetical protein AB1449_15040 [Chloroflexota bacterium]